MTDYTPGALGDLLQKRVNEIGHHVSGKKQKRKSNKHTGQVQDDANLQQPPPKTSIFDRYSKRQQQNASDDIATEPNIAELSGDNDELASEPTKKSKLGHGASASTKEELDRTVFVGNLPLSCDRKALRALFAEFGDIESVRLRSAIPDKKKMPKRAAVITQCFSGSLNNIIGYVKFRHAKDATRALKRNGFMHNDHSLRVDGCSTKPRYDPKRTVFVGNMPFSCTDDELRDFFGKIPNIELVRIIRDKFTGNGKGIGFVGFKDITSVDLALKMDGTQFREREIRIRRIHSENEGTSSTKKPKKLDRDKVKSKVLAKKRANEHYFSAADNNKKPFTRRQNTGETDEKRFPPKKVMKKVKAKHQKRKLQQMFAKKRSL